MAQRIVHYAIAKELINKNIIKNEYNFIIGSIIPDSNEHTPEHYNKTHYIIYGENIKTINFNKFFKKYKDKIFEDEIYLGYYVHLITDCLYRHFMYNIKDLKSHKKDENFRIKLYDDYNSLNRVLIEKYNLSIIEIDEKIIPKEFDLYDIPKFQGEIDSDFNVKYDENKFNYLTENIIYEFIDYAVNIIYNHIIDIKSKNGKLLEEYWW